MKFLIAGLGNIGFDYVNTRHNIGFDIADRFASEFDTTFNNDKYADVADVKHKGRQFTVIKPTTYMNLSGKAVRYWMEKLKIPTENVLVIVDDLALPLGRIRLRKKGSDGGHNGLKSITALLQTNQYPRLRVGIGDEFAKGRQVDYVLGKWTEGEQKQLPEVIKNAVEAIKSFGTIGIERTMNIFNN